MNRAVLPEEFCRDSGLYDAYTTAADQLTSDGQFVRARDAWATFVRNSHGDIFDEMDESDSRTTAFVDALYYDFVVAGALDAAESSLGVELENRAATDNTDALDVDFDALHRRVSEQCEGELGSATPTERLPPEEPLRFLRELHGGTHTDQFRSAFGAYYTPRGIAELAVESIDISESREESVLDPACGSGVFLAAAIDRKLSALEGALSPATAVATVTDTVMGIDLDPLAVRSAKLTYLLSLAPALRESTLDSVALPVFLTDSLGLAHEDDITFRDTLLDIEADHLVGNPPWLTWGDLAESVRERWQAPAERLGLIPDDGGTARLGHGNDDISVSFLWVCLDRYATPDADAAVVLKREVRTGPAGRPFRRGTVGDRAVAVTGVEDFGDLRPFDADVGAACYTLAADAETAFPIPTGRWRATARDADFTSLTAMERTLDRSAGGLLPVDPDAPHEGWVRADADRQAVGDCQHTIRHGLKDDAKAVFSVDGDLLDRIEPDHVYPYLRSKHVVKYGLFGYDRHLVPMGRAGEDNEAELREHARATYEYLRANRERLEARASSWFDDGPFYSLFGLGEYTWAPYKLVWCRLGFKPHFAVVSTVTDDELGEKTVVPGDHCMFVALDDREAAHYLCALLNSAPYQRCLRDLSSNGKASLSKSLVSKLALPTFEGSDRQRRLAKLSMRAHDIVPEYTGVSKRTYNERTIVPLQRVQAEIDEAVTEWLEESPSS